ncbi:phosphatidylglycerophosphatase A [Tissierella sp. Yu-01]|uniref:phosphatidylglycerophosphatase A family protein n=1 Tax=Tissierella sp. Yu-01 TaxID=3035694 RepID=UPI00240E0D2B|nr:phosphatidylglycerophosphatase A [Tissierella sp. Yu-01]WFA07862.1 phosphatidylglycerophosphatase A [Tissierella sp. Yu-01]
MSNLELKYSERYKTEDLKKKSIEMLEKRGVRLEDIAEIVLYLQSKYYPGLTLEICIENIDAVLSKREIIHAILTGIALDELAEKKLLPEPLQTIVETDEGLYGIDEIIPLSIVNVYGTIGLTNYGYLDKEKIGIIKELDSKKGVECNTFLDDLVAAIAAAAASRIAHTRES